MGFSQRMIRAALARPTSTLVAAFTLAAVGLCSLLKLPVSLLPALEKPRLIVTARAAGHSREEIVQQLTEPLEQRLSSLPGLASIWSETDDGIARVVLEAAWQTDIDRLRIEIARRTDGVTKMPLDELTVAVGGGDASPIVEVAVLGGESGGARSRFATRLLVPELARLEGAGRIEVIGDTPLHAIVHPSLAALAARGLTVNDIVQRLDKVGRPLGGGEVREGGVVRPLVVRESASSLDDLRRIVISSGGIASSLGDLAQIRFEEITNGTSFSLNGQKGVLLRVYRAPGANAVAMSRRVRKRVADLSSQRAGSLRLHIVSDLSTDVIQGITDLGVSALTGLLLGVLVLRFFLGAWKPTLALFVAIPASLLISFAAFYAAGIAIDLVSLSGLALAAGLLVDNSIVVLEAIERARERTSADPVTEGTRQVATAVIASTATTVIVFLPLLYLRGLARAFFGEQAFAVVTTLTISILFSLTVTPVLARRQRSAAGGRSPGLGAYGSVLSTALRRPNIALMIGAAITIVTMVSLALLPRELFPRSHQKKIVVDYRLPSDLSEDELVTRSRQLSELLRKNLGPASIAATGGLPEPTAAGVATEIVPSLGRIVIELPVSSAAADGEAAVRKLAERVPGLLARVHPLPSALSESISADARASFVVAASDEKSADTLAARAAEAVRRSKGWIVVADETEVLRPTIFLDWDQQRLALTDSDRDQLEQQVRAALERRAAGRLELEGFEPEILVGPVALADAGILPLRLGSSPDGATRIAPLGALARTSAGLRQARMLRIEGRPARRFFVLDEHRREGVELAALERILRTVPRSQSQTIQMRGDAPEIAVSFAQLKLAFILSLLLMFLVIAGVYESILIPLIVLCAVPVAAGGAATLLLLTGQTLNLMSGIGMILLGGIVVNHSVVLMDRVEQLRRSGRDEIDALEEAGRERYRPIVMTTVITMLGMLPLSLLPGDGVELRRAIATTVLGGLATATFASLFLLPVLHLRLQRFQRREKAVGS
ncbi:MAG TPA: efflux RND transporter permease subunit [Thermoanaerobaculia bacterium]|nr:efflux RND transporter permease subunit [Thermoanaerobaculia bacterium]